jgi:signal transduction histidine kinase
MVVGAVFALLLNSVQRERDSARLARHSQQVLAAANSLERLVLDLETGQRGLSLTGQQRFLEPWHAARAAIPSANASLVSLTAVPEQAARARRVTASVNSYIRNYSDPLIAAIGRDPAAGRSISAADEGKRRVDDIRAQFDDLTAAEQRLSTARDRRSTHDAQMAVTVATAGLAGSTLLVFLFGGYLTRSIVVPLRRAATMAGRLAAGDLSTRMAETGPAEIGALERAFNTMGASLEANRDELRTLADEQAALRRVATLVARGVPSDDLLEAVVGEVDGVLGASSTRLARFEPNNTVTVIVSSDPTDHLPVGTTFAADGKDTIVGRVYRTRRTARRDSNEDVSGYLGDQLSEMGVRCSVGAPIVVDRRLWGTIIAYWTDHEPPIDVEARLSQFTDLVATAIANTDSRAALTASRARVVATADETRRRIERDLHDGAQQRLVHTVITLKLARRALGDRDGQATDLVDEALDHAERATAALRDLVHGILPAALSRGGLRAGVDALVSRLPIPVSVDVTGERLPPVLEATAYFIVAEALTNVIKHAGAHSAQITASVDGEALHLEVRDDGVGGASLEGSSGLLGLHDRAAAVDGELSLDSPAGGGTVVAAKLPIPDG